MKKRQTLYPLGHELRASSQKINYDIAKAEKFYSPLSHGVWFLLVTTKLDKYMFLMAIF
jgi:hypothetical protein